MKARVALLACALAAQPARADDGGLLFRASADKSLTAEVAGGEAQPNFASGVEIVPGGAINSAMQASDGGYVAWRAPGNIYAQHGTLAFFWRPREAVGEAPFVIFRVGFADHSSWDMAFARIDWNGHGFDAFVTDANLARVRVSWTMPARPAPDAWHHLAFGWDEARGVVLYVDGREVARKVQAADLDAGLDQFGMAGRVIAPHQVQSRYNFMRGSDLDELRIYDHLIDAREAAALAAKAEPPAPAPPASTQQAWLHRFGWDRAAPPVLDAPITTVRKVEFADAKDLKQWMWKGVDGIAETTWPGVYNRSRLPGRNDYFTLPDWNTYVEGGRRYDLTIPPGETVNRVELRGAAFGTLDWIGPDGKSRRLATRLQGAVRSVDSFAAVTGGTLRFTNAAQETPIQELWAYAVSAAPEPAGRFKLRYTIDAAASPAFAALEPLNRHIAGRYPAAERATVVARPASAGVVAAGAGDPSWVGAASRPAGLAPIVHVLIPDSYADAFPGQPLARAWNYGWDNLRDGLDGVALDLPALDLAPDATGLIPLNIAVMDPLWPGRAMIDLPVAVRPSQPRTLWLDLRDRILPNAPLWLRIASAHPGFTAQSLDKAAIRLVFKDRAAALTEHIADRFNQVKDNWAFLVEEHTASARAALYERLRADITDLLRVDPDNALAQTYWADINYTPENLPAFTQPQPPAGVPLWAFRQLEDLKRVQRFVDWWIDRRQVPYGDFGGGLSDDTDLVQQWPGLALMGVEPDRINASLRKLDEAVYANGMMTGGLGTITTDELHAYEEGLNADAARLLLNWGEPRTLERLMATTRALGGVIRRNPAGHLHFASNWYGGTKIYREGPWEWQKPYSFTVLHAPILLGLYNRNPAATGMVTGLVDGWLAHGKADAAGQWSFPNEINWRSDAERKGDGGGATTPLQAAWAAWRLTGEDRFLRPLRGRLASGGGKVLSEINENAFAVLPDGARQAASLAPKSPAEGSEFARYAAWNASGDPAWLAALHGDALADKARREYLVTEGHWWTDRVEAPSETLQRERLGGIALKRNQTWPGHTVSWRFDDPAGATQVAILLPGATRERFRLIAHNTGDAAQSATMTAWTIAPGQWRMTAGTSADDGRTMAPTGTPTAIPLETGATTRLAFAPHTTVVFDFERVKPAATDPHDRPDLGIGADDVAVSGRTLTVTVHSMGAKPVPGGTVQVEDRAGTVVANASFGAMAAPVDLLPKTVRVRLALPASLPDGARVRVMLPDDADEVTRLNNVVALPISPQRP